jgi:hypoxanthine phosphoribosyltransferase
VRASSHTYNEGHRVIRELAAEIRKHLPESASRHHMLNMLSNLNSCLLVLDGERQDAVDELVDAREALVEALQELGKRT